MPRRTTLIVAGIAALAAFVLGGAAIAGAPQMNQEEGNQPVSGAAAESAQAAALKEAGGGTVTELARDPEGARIYEVEVMKPDGTVVDIDLDSSFNVLAAENDRDEANESARDDQDDNEPDDQDDRNEQDESDD
jgi:hypothetical protein